MGIPNIAPVSGDKSDTWEQNVTWMYLMYEIGHRFPNRTQMYLMYEIGLCFSNRTWLHTSLESKHLLLSPCQPELRLGLEPEPKSEPKNGPCVRGQYRGVYGGSIGPPAHTGPYTAPYAGPYWALFFQHFGEPPDKGGGYEGGLHPNTLPSAAFFSYMRMVAYQCCVVCVVVCVSVSVCVVVSFPICPK